MLALLAQLHCAIELMPAAVPPAAPPATAAAAVTGTEHVFEFVDALTGETLSPGDVGALVPVAYGPSGPLETRVRTDDEAGSPLRRYIALPAAGTYAVRVDGLGSRRYYGCEADLPAAGESTRNVRIALVPRARDVVLHATIARGSTERAFTPFGLRDVELRADAQSERETEVFRGTCAGEHPASGSHWCVVSLAARPGDVGLSARAPDYGVVSMRMNANDPARDVPVNAAFAGHVLGNVSLRAGAMIGVLGAGSPGAMLALDVPTRSDRTGDACPAAETCARALVHLGGAYGGYGRDTELVGPASAVSADGATSAAYGMVEVGAGVTVAPSGTGDRLRLTGLIAGALVARGEERRADDTLLTAATTRPGFLGDVLASVRLVGPLTVFAGLRTLWVPNVGPRGRQFSYLGAATVSPESASLVQMSVLVGLGVEP